MSDPADTPAPEAPAPKAPRSDPQAFQLRGPTPRVMRLSRKALAVMGMVASLSIGGALTWALRPAGERAPKELYGTDSRATSETIISGPKDYSQVPKLGPRLPGDLGGPIVSAQQRGQNVPVPPVGAQPDPRVQAAEAARQRIAQERDAARTSTLFLGGGAGVGRVGRGVGNSGSVNVVSGSRVAVPSIDDWHPASAATLTSAPAMTCLVLIVLQRTQLWRE